MKADASGTEIILQVGPELRSMNEGNLVIDNPELELAGDESAADATLVCRFDPVKGERLVRLLNPVVDHKYIKSHRRDDGFADANSCTIL